MRTRIQEVVYPFGTAHLQVVVAAKADVVVLLEVLDVQDDAALVAPCPQALGAVHGLGGLHQAEHRQRGAARARARGPVGKAPGPCTG
jgi:hypothetical protein